MHIYIIIEFLSEQKSCDEHLFPKYSHNKFSPSTYHFCRHLTAHGRRSLTINLIAFQVLHTKNRFKHTRFASENVHVLEIRIPLRKINNNQHHSANSFWKLVNHRAHRTSHVSFFCITTNRPGLVWLWVCACGITTSPAQAFLSRARLRNEAAKLSDVCCSGSSTAINLLISLNVVVETSSEC